MNGQSHRERERQRENWMKINHIDWKTNTTSIQRPQRPFSILGIFSLSSNSGCKNKLNTTQKRKNKKRKKKRHFLHSYSTQTQSKSMPTHQKTCAYTATQSCKLEPPVFQFIYCPSIGEQNLVVGDDKLLINIKMNAFVCVNSSDFKLGTWNHMPPRTWWFFSITLSL